MSGSLPWYELQEALTHLHDLPVGVARRLQRLVAARILGPPPVGPHAALMPPARLHEHADERYSALDERRELLVHDVVRREERPAHEQQRSVRTADGILDLRTPFLAHEQPIVAPHVEALLAYDGLEHGDEPLAPLRVLAAVADEDHVASAGAALHA